MAKMMQLEEFFVTKVHLDWHGFDDAEDAAPALVESEISVFYDVACHTEQPYSFALKLLCSLSPSSNEGLEVHAEIVGLFRFPEGTPNDVMEASVRVNGGTILYGILRGQIASMTGSFPSGKAILPTVSMVEIVEHVEKGRRPASKPKKTPKAKAKSARKGPSH